MTPSRARPALVALVFLLASLVVPPALATHEDAGSVTDLETARREAEEAKQQRDAAQAAFDARLAERNDLGSRVDAALSRYQNANFELESVALTVAGFRHEVDETTDDVRSLSDVAQQRAVGAYMRGFAALDTSPLTSSSFEEFAVLGQSIADLSDADVQVFADLDDRRSELEELRAGLDVLQAEMRALRDLLELRHTQLLGVFALADIAYLESFENLEDVEADYQLALETLDAAERARRWSGDIEQWRPLVEQYFPEERVHEAMAVMACESGGNPDAKNPNSTATGLFQFLKGTWAWASVSAGWASHSRLEPEANIASAAWLLDYSIRTNHPLGDWGHWECQP